MKKETKKLISKILKILRIVVTILLLVVLVFILVQKFSNNKITIGGISVYSIISESMVPEYKIGDIIVSKKTEPENLEIGDDVTYKGETGDFYGMTVTHRIIDKREENGKYYFTTKGIANEIADPEISEDAIYDKVVYKTFIFSLLGRLMSNIVVYYILFMLVGVSVSYQIISGFLIKRKEDEEGE